jgi:hypothetical protein
LFTEQYYFKVVVNKKPLIPILNEIPKIKQCRMPVTGEVVCSSSDELPYV